MKSLETSEETDLNSQQKLKSPSDHPRMSENFKGLIQKDITLQLPQYRKCLVEIQVS